MPAKQSYSIVILKSAMKIPGAISLIVALAAPLGAGFLGSMATLPQIKGWYSRIKKPTWNPPNWIFGPVWSVLYLSMGLASWLTFQSSKRGAGFALGLYAGQLVLNLCWSPIFFSMHRPDIATLDALAMLGVASAATVEMSKVAGKAKILPLMVPYLMWTSFAACLSAKIAQLNPNAHLIDASPAKPGEGAKSK
jgi:benzodiazapine receptor